MKQNSWAAVSVVLLQPHKHALYWWSGFSRANVASASQWQCPELRIHQHYSACHLGFELFHPPLNPSCSIPLCSPLWTSRCSEKQNNIVYSFFSFEKSKSGVHSFGCMNGNGVTVSPFLNVRCTPYYNSLTWELNVNHVNAGGMRPC